MTIQEIARLAGVSPATVSRVFANHPNVRPEAREKVLALAKRRGYRPKLSDKRKNVLVMVPFDPLFPVHSCVDMLLTAHMRELSARGFRVEILPCDNLDRIDRIQFCAAVAIGVEADFFPDWDRRFASPLVIADRTPPSGPHPGVFYVSSDEAQGMALAIGHLAGRGCRNIGCIVHGDPGRGKASVRESAIRRELLRRGLPADPGTVVFSGLGSERYVELTGRLLQRGADALFCPGGNAGIAVLYALSLFGKKVPDDISLVSSELVHYSSCAVPPQTTITQQYAAVAEQSVTLIEALSENRRAPASTVLPYRLIERDSVRRP